MTKEKLLALRAKYEAQLAGPTCKEVAEVDKKVEEYRASLMAELDAKYADAAKEASVRIPFIDELIALEDLEPEVAPVVEEPVAEEPVAEEPVVVDNEVPVEEVQEVVEEPVIEERHGFML